MLRNRHSYLNESGAKTNLHQTIEVILTLRNNNTGHGALRTVYEYKQIVEQEEDRLYSFFDRLWISGDGRLVPRAGLAVRRVRRERPLQDPRLPGLNISDNDLLDAQPALGGAEGYDGALHLFSKHIEQHYCESLSVSLVYVLRQLQAANTFLLQRNQG